jgi:hypothetical protein
VLATTFTRTQHTQQDIQKPREIILMFSVIVIILKFVPYFLLVYMPKRTGIVSDDLQKYTFIKKTLFPVC